MRRHLQVDFQARLITRHPWELSEPAEMKGTNLWAPPTGNVVHTPGLWLLLVASQRTHQATLKTSQDGKRQICSILPTQEREATPKSPPKR